MHLLQTQKSYVVHHKFWRHILDGDASGFHSTYKLINIHHLVTFHEETNFLPKPVFGGIQPGPTQTGL